MTDEKLVAATRQAAAAMTPDTIRRAGFLLTLAYATDLAIGQSRDFAARSCVLAMRIAEAIGLPETDRRNVFHQALLRYVGCNAGTHLMSALFGDEIAFRRDFARIDIGNRVEIAETVSRAVMRAHSGAPAPEMARLIERGLTEDLPASLPILAGHCEVARRIGARLGLDAGICDGLAQLYERWDGKGLPLGLKGEAIVAAVRVVSLAQDAIVLAEAFGQEAMRRTVNERRGTAYDPALADLLTGQSARLMDGLDTTADRAAILALEPQPHAVLADENLEAAYLVLADMADMRMPFTFGHSRAVAKLAEAAGRRLALPAANIRDLRRAGLAHDIGELAVPVATWMRPGPLTAFEKDAARLHPYHGERMLSGFGEAGKGVAALVARHHERLDGSGYHRGARAPDLSPAARILAAAEAFQTARESRPHRPAISDSAAAGLLRAMVRDGRIDGPAAEAVLAAAGQAGRRSPQGDDPARLTAREIEVLRLIAAGRTVKETAAALRVAFKTADNHTQNLYSKIGVSTRSGAVLFALERGLTPPSNGSA